MPYVTGDDRIDSLLAGATVRWGAAGTTPTVTYSFMSAVPSYAGANDGRGFSSFNDAQKAAARLILQSLQSEFNINFQEVPDSTQSFGKIRFGNNDQGAVSAGYAYYPDNGTDEQGGDVYINNAASARQLDDLSPGTNAWATLLHEVLHAIGLKHPGNYNAGEASGTQEGPFLPTATDNARYTIMSYTDHPQGIERIDLGIYDRLALTTLYGARTSNAGSTTFTLTNDSGRSLRSIADSNGVDTIDASVVTSDLKLYLTAGKMSSVGQLANGTATVENLSIAFDTVIENAYGGPANDLIEGNDYDNLLRGNAGNDVLTAFGGTDVMTGGSGSDVFNLGGGGHFRIEDFTPGEDSLNFDSGRLGITSLAQLLPFVTGLQQLDRSVLITFVNNVASIELVGLTTAQVTADIVGFRAY